MESSMKLFDHLNLKSNLELSIKQNVELNHKSNLALILNLKLSRNLALLFVAKKTLSV